MLQRIIGFILGGLTIWVLLNITNALAGDAQPKYALSILIGLPDLPTLVSHLG
jgi:hypothetical protein